MTELLAGVCPHDGLSMVELQAPPFGSLSEATAWQPGVRAWQCPGCGRVMTCEPTQPHDALRAELEQHAARATQAPPDGESIGLTVVDGELAALALGLSEKSTAAQRALGREVLFGWITQACEQVVNKYGTPE